MGNLETLGMQPYSTKSQMLQSTDWMAVSIILDDELPHDAPPNHFWQVYDHGTPVWNHRACLFNEYGEKVLTLLAKPKQTTFLQPRQGLVEIANEWLYRGVGVGGALDELHWCCPFTVTGLSRLDLCMDFVPTPEQCDIIKGLSRKEYYVSGKRNRSEFCSTPSESWVPPVWRGWCPHQQAWGHKTTQVKWKLYYKSKELRDNGKGWFDKPYIVDGWRHYGLDENNVWRLEVSMTDCNSLLREGAEITYSKWAADEMGIFAAMYCSRFVIRKNEHHKDKTNDTIVPFLPIDTVSRVRCKRYESETGRSARIGLLRSLIKYGEQEEVFMDATASAALTEHVENLVNHDNLERYFESAVGMSLGQWTKQMVERREGKVVIDRNLPKNTDIHQNNNF